MRSNDITRPYTRTASSRSLYVCGRDGFGPVCLWPSSFGRVGLPCGRVGLYSTRVAEMDLAQFVCGRIGLAEWAYHVAEMVNAIGRDGLWPTWMRPRISTVCTGVVFVATYGIQFSAVLL